MKAWLSVLWVYSAESRSIHPSLCHWPPSRPHDGQSIGLGGGGAEDLWEKKKNKNSNMNTSMNNLLLGRNSSPSAVLETCVTSSELANRCLHDTAALHVLLLPSPRLSVLGTRRRHRHRQSDVIRKTWVCVYVRACVWRRKPKDLPHTSTLPPPPLRHRPFENLISGLCGVTENLYRTNCCVGPGRWGGGCVANADDLASMFNAVAAAPINCAQGVRRSLSGCSIPFYWYQSGAASLPINRFSSRVNSNMGNDSCCWGGAGELKTAIMKVRLRC